MNDNIKLEHSFILLVKLSATYAFLCVKARLGAYPDLKSEVKKIFVLVL
jgi:hypothetical protein